MQATIDLPDWAVAENEKLPERIESLEERMKHVIRFSRLNIEHETGGPKKPAAPSLSESIALFR